MPHRRPDASEYAPFYGTSIDQVPDGPVLDRLEHQIAETAEFLRSVPADREGHRYAPDRWSIREVVGHVLDIERVFGLRALHFARSDPAPLPGVDQDAWAGAAGYGERPLGDLVEELEAVRRSSVALFRGLPDDAWSRTGVASGVTFTVRAIPWILAGHEIHHRRVLRERYLESPGASN